MYKLYPKMHFWKNLYFCELLDRKFIHFVRYQCDSLFSSSQKDKSVWVQIIFFVSNFSQKMHGALKTCLIYKQEEKETGKS